MAEKKVILFSTEEFKFEKLESSGQTQIIISGNAQPLYERSRNGVIYRPESVKKNYQSLKGVAFLFNHDTNQPKGHVIDVGLSETHVTYRSDIDPMETDFLRKVERGDIKHVSVGCLVDNPEWDEATGDVTVDLVEYVELSSVPVPGFANTSAMKENSALYVAEAFGNTEMVEKLKAKAKAKETADSDDKDKKEEEDPEDKDKKDSEKCKEAVCDKCGKEPCECPKEDGQNLTAKKEEANPNASAPTTEEQVKVLSSRVEELFSKNEELVNRVTILESKEEARAKSDLAAQDQADKAQKEDPQDPAQDDGQDPKEDPKSGDEKDGEGKEGDAADADPADQEGDDKSDEAEDPKDEDPDKKKDDEENLTPDKSEKFTSDKKDALNKALQTTEGKKILDEAKLSKTDALLGKNASIKETKKEVDMNKVRLKNVSY